MFYHADILKRKRPLGRIWLASIYGKKFSTPHERRSINIPRVCHEILHPSQVGRFALRLSSRLMFGVVRVYQDQTEYFYTLLLHFWKSIKTPDDSSPARIDMVQPNPLKRNDVTDESWLDELDHMPQHFSSPLSTSSSSDEKDDGKMGEDGDGSSSFQSPREEITLKETLQKSGEEQIKVLDDVDLTGEKVDPDVDIFPPDLPESPLPPITEDQPMPDLTQKDDDIVVVIDTETGELKPVEETSPSTPSTPSPDVTGKLPDLATPPVPVPESLPSPPRKKKRLAIDRKIKQDREFIRRNVQTSHELVRLRNNGCPRESAKDLFAAPATSDQKLREFFGLWKTNAVVQPCADEEFLSRDAERSPELDEPEFPRGYDDSVEGLRRSSRDVSSDLEISARSGLDATPNTSNLERSSIGEHGQPNLEPAPQRKSSLVPPALSPIIDRDVPDMDDFSPIGEVPTFMEEEAEPQWPITEELSAVLRDIRGIMSGRHLTRVEFNEILPRNADKHSAVLAFYQVLVLHHIGEIALDQDEPYAELYIAKGPHYGRLSL